MGTENEESKMDAVVVWRVSLHCLCFVSLRVSQAAVAPLYDASCVYPDLFIFHGGHLPPVF